MESASVIIPTYKRPHLVLRAVKSACAQPGSVTEIIVVNDDSDASGRFAAREIYDAVSDPRLRIISNTRKKGGCGARNCGILAAKGDLIAFLDDDDVLLPRVLDRQAARFTRPRVGMVYGAAQVVDEVFGRRWVSILPYSSLSFECGSGVRSCCPALAS
jgi:glycosyltransferase involved in cell wall biosynthesis